VAGKGRKKPGRVSEQKVARTYRLAPGRIETARKILGVRTATAAIETALDMVVFRQELIDGTRAMRGVVVEPFDDAEA
jgi:hypothetical protein